MKTGDWVAQKYELDVFPFQPLIGKVLDVYDDCFNLCVYSPSGTKIGRESALCGGPTSFEPSLEIADYVVIAKPKFPLPKYGWGSVLKEVEKI